MTVATASLIGARVAVKIPAWLQTSEALATRELEGVVERESANGIFLNGHASMRPADHCHRCNTAIGYGVSRDSTVSRMIGYGPDCCEYLGIPRDLPENLVDEVRARVVVTTAWQGWLPKSKITVEVLGQAFVPEPTSKPDVVVGHCEFCRADGVALVATLDADSDQRVCASCHQDSRLATTTTTEAPAAVIKLTVLKDRIHIQAPFAWKDRIKDELPGRAWDKTAKRWTLPASPVAAANAVSLFGILASTDDAVKELLAKAETRVKVAEFKNAEELPEIPSTNTPAWLHQKQAYWFGEQLESLGLFMDMGTGKSKVVVDLVANRGHKRVLIICPTAVVGVWPKQFRLHSSKPVAVVAPRRKPPTKRSPAGTMMTVVERAAAIEGALASTPVDQPLVCVTNYEASYLKPMNELLLGQQWDFIVLDESHRIKKPGGKTSQFCGHLGRRGSHKAILTGTPMPHSPLDVYAQYRFVDPSIFGTNFATFRARYAIMGGYENHEVLGYTRQDELAEKMYGIGFRVMAEDVLNLIPPLHEERFCSLEPSAVKVYRALYDDLIADVGDGTVTAANALVRLLRLQQVTSGALPVEDPDTGEEEVTIVSTAKAELLADTLEDLGPHEPVVVFCRFSHELTQVAAIAEKQGRRYGELSGKRKDGLTEDSTMRDDVDVLGVQIQSGGVGIDLTRARYVIYMSTGFGLGDYEQSLARVQRPGQERQVVYYHLHCEDTIDLGVAKALANRKDVVEFVMGLGS